MGIIQFSAAAIDDVAGITVFFQVKVAAQNHADSPICSKNLAPPNVGETTLSG